MDRKERTFIPVFEGPIEGWTVNFIRKNYWRVGHLYEFEDLLQECYIKFLKCCESYPTVNAPSHFMSLYKSAVTNHFHDISKQRTLEESLIQREFHDEVDIEALLENSGGFHCNEGFLLCLLKKAPQEIQDLLAKLVAGDDILTSKYQKKRNGNRKATRQTTNEKFCSALGLDPKKYDVATMVRDYFDVGEHKNVEI